jgi:hypothetical protein
MSVSRAWISQYLLCLLSLLLVACDATDNTSRRIALVYDPELARADFLSPAARVTVNGRTTWLLFDTGAGVHVLTPWFAKAANLRVEDLSEQTSIVDATGSAASFRAVRATSAELADGTSLILDLAAVVDFAPEFEQLDIGGIVSPQLLANASQAVTLDLRAPELRFEAFDDAMRRLGARAVASDNVTFCGDLKGPVPNLVMAIRAESPHGTGSVVIDSGANATKLNAGSALVRGAELSGGGESSGFSGQRQPYSLAPNLPLTFHDASVTVGARVSDPAGRPCEYDGLLGLDAIRRCALVMGPDRLAIRCEP